jgi:Nif-specific ferredoxin III
MSSIITGVTRGGSEWVPAFIVSLNQENCIGCGRCYKVCPREVFELIEREAAEEDDDSDDDFSDDTSMVMAISNALDCIGCQACAKVCPKDCQTHEPQPPVAA